MQTVEVIKHRPIAVPGPLDGVGFGEFGMRRANKN
jgi:hypothetical protein